MRWFICLLLVAAITRADDTATTEWDSLTIGGVSFQLPTRWSHRVIEPVPAPDGTIFNMEYQRQVWLRIRVLPRTGEMPKARSATRDALAAEDWKDLAESMKAAGYELLEGGAGRSRVVNGVLQDEVVIATKHNGTPKGFRLAVFTLPDKLIRAEFTYVRGISSRVHGETIEVWNSVKFDRASASAQNVAASSLAAPTAGAARVAIPRGATPAPVARNVADLVQHFRDCLVFIEGGGGSGSGFICKTADGAFLYTNQHVVAGMPRIQCTKMDGSAVKIGAASAAVGHDEMRFAIDMPPVAFDAAGQIESFARIGDEVAVLGNSEGSRVIAPLRGKLVGIGPDRIEVDAQFVPGNSGSPIVHVPTGKVIGIATYLTKRRYTELTDKKEPAIRRFGYRLDSVKQWQPVDWRVFQGEKAEVDKVNSLTLDFARLLDDVAADGKLDPGLHRNSGLGRIIADLDRAFGRQAPSAADRQRLFQNFLLSLRAATRADLIAAKSRLRYDYFLRQLSEETAIRDEFHAIFDKSAKAFR